MSDDTTDCWYDDQGCMHCPDRAAVPARPASVATTNPLGWNAGANTVDMLDGDLHALLTMPAGVLGVILGLKGSRAQQTLPTLIEHGFYFQRAAGVDGWQIFERGQALTAFMPRTAETTFELRRQGATVRYFVAGALVFTSTQPSLGRKLLNACLYSSGDSVPSGVAQGGLPTNTPLVAQFNYTSTGLSVAFVDASTDSDGTIASHAWTFGDGGTSTDASPTHSYAASGSYTVSLTVTDNAGATDTTSRSVSVSSTYDPALVAQFGYTISGSVVTFTDTSIDGDGSIVSWAWDFGDGATSTEQNPVHDYGSNTSNEWAVLTVTDSNGHTSTFSKNVFYTYTWDMQQQGTLTVGQLTELPVIDMSGNSDGTQDFYYAFDIPSGVARMDVVLTDTPDAAFLSNGGSMTVFKEGDMAGMVQCFNAPYVITLLNPPAGTYRVAFEVCCPVMTGLKLQVVTS